MAHSSISMADGTQRQLATAAQQQQQQAELMGLLFSAVRLQEGISQVIGDLLSSIAQQALGANALGGASQQAQVQQVAAPPQSLLAFRSSNKQGSKQQQRLLPAISSDPASWRLGLQPAAFTAPMAATAEAVVSSSVSRPPGALVLLLGPRQSGKSSMLRDVAATLAADGCVSVAAVDMDSRLAAAGSLKTG
jgi:hypothetical protein